MNENIETIIKVNVNRKNAEKAIKWCSMMEKENGYMFESYNGTSGKMPHDYVVDTIITLIKIEPLPF